MKVALVFFIIYIPDIYVNNMHHNDGKTFIYYKNEIHNNFIYSTHICIFLYLEQITGHIIFPLLIDFVYVLF